MPGSTLVDQGTRKGTIVKYALFVKDSPELIRTERGAGYVFTAPVEIVR